MLNAFIWCLFEETTPGFTMPTDLCNHQAKLELAVGEKVESSVEVAFLHGYKRSETRYLARRSLAIERTGPSKDDFEEKTPQFSLNIYPLDSGKDARLIRDEEAQQEIQEIIPASLSPYFFFPAENIGSSIGSSSSKTASVKGAVTVLLGLRQFEVAEACIKNALGLPKLKEKTSDDLDIRKAQEVKNEIRDEHDKVRAETLEKGKEIQRLETMVNALARAIDQASEEGRIIEDHNRIREGYLQAKREADQSALERQNLLELECFNFFGAGVLQQARHVLDRAAADAIIPPRVSAGLLDDLIENSSECICGQPIYSRERKVLRRLRQEIVEDIVAETASNIRARVAELADSLSARRNELAPHSLLGNCNIALANAHRKMSNWNRQLEEFLSEHPNPTRSFGSEPHKAFLQHTHTLEGLRKQQASLLERETILIGERRAADMKYDSLTTKKGIADKISKARGQLIRIEQTVEDILRVLRDSSRKDLERAINQIAKDVLLRDYSIHLKEDYTIEARQDGMEIGGSSSDNAWITFAFVGAISKLMDMYDKKLSNLDEAGNIELDLEAGYPLVLDAPFSPFGETYASDFAERLRDLAPQSVLFVRADQIRFLEPILHPDSALTRVYLMCLHGPPSTEPQAIPWRDGSERAYVLPADNHISVRTELKELPL